jgi:hypothetical protein
LRSAKVNCLPKASPTKLLLCTQTMERIDNSHTGLVEDNHTTN